MPESPTAGRTLARRRAPGEAQANFGEAGSQRACPPALPRIHRGCSAALQFEIAAIVLPPASQAGKHCRKSSTR